MDSAATQCQFCWRVRDDGADMHVTTEWGELSTFLQKYEVKPHHLTLSEGYCPQCNQFYCQLTQQHLYET